MHKITVVIPVYNQHPIFVKQAIDSLKNQIFFKEVETEIIVVDDGSTNGWYNKVDLTGVNFYTLNKNMGAPYAINYGVKMSQGNYFALLSSDDYYFQDKLDTQLSLMLETKTQFSFTGYREYLIEDWTIVAIREVAAPEANYFDGKVFNRELRKNDFCNNFINGASILVEMNKFLEVGGYDESLIYQPDFDLSLKLTDICRTLSIPESYMVRRNHDNQTKHLMAGNPETEENYRRTIEYAKIKLRWCNTVFPVNRPGINIEQLRKLGYV